MSSSDTTLEPPRRSARAAEPLAGNYFVAAYPPFSSWQPAASDILDLSRPGHSRPVGLYIHIPFCEKKCSYCYYLSHEGASQTDIQDYLENVTSELTLYAQTPALRGRPVSFVYFGGGSPSVLSAERVRSLAAGLRESLPWQDAEEITFEVAPRTVRRDRLEALREIGVNRISMGVQSLDDVLLRQNGRIHLSADVIAAYRLIREHSFDWVNLDLMVGLLGETWPLWRLSVERIIELEPDSVTVYQTEVPHNTRLYEDLEAGLLSADLISWEAKRERLNFAFEELERAGYTVVSGYCAVRDPDRHRFRYQECLWRGEDMIGLGVAAFSYLDGVHFQNVKGLPEYGARVRKRQKPISRALRLSRQERLVRGFILQLKCGFVNAAEFRDRFQVEVTEEFSAPLAKLADEGYLTVSDQGVRLTRAGLLRVDRLLPRFYQAEYRDAG